MLSEFTELLKIIVLLLTISINQTTMNFIEILSGLLTPMIAIIAAYIAFQQYRSNKKQGKLKLELDTVNSQLEKNRVKLEEYKLRLGLYNKRYQIFDKTKKLLHKINQDAKIDLIDLRDFIFDTNESKFLFDNDISSFLVELKENANKLTHLTDDLKNINHYQEGQVEKESKVERDSELISWFTYEYENIELKFDKYLNFKNL